MCVRILDEHNKDAVVNLFRDEITQTDIAFFLNVSRRTIQRVLQERGYLPPTVSKEVSNAN